MNKLNVKQDKLYITNSGDLIEVLNIDEQINKIFYYNITQEKNITKDIRKCIETNFFVKKVSERNLPVDLRQLYLKYDNKKYSKNGISSLYNLNSSFKIIQPHALSNGDILLNIDFMDIISGMIELTFDKKDGVRSNKRTKFFNQRLLKYIKNGANILFEKYITTMTGRKRADILITDKDGNATYVSCMFPCQSILKNKNNSHEHVADPIVASISDDNNIKRGIGFIFLPTKTLVKNKGVFKEEDVLANYLKEDSKFIREQTYYIKIDEDKEIYEKLEYKQFVVFYEPNEKFFDVIRNNNAVKDDYVKNIYNLDVLKEFLNTLNN